MMSANTDATTVTNERIKDAVKYAASFAANIDAGPGRGEHASAYLALFDPTDGTALEMLRQY